MRTSHYGLAGLGRQSRSLLVYALVSLVPVLLIAGVLVHDQRGGAQERVLERGRTQARMIQALGISPALTGADLDDLRTADFTHVIQVTQLAVFEGAVRYVEIHDAAGMVLLSRGSSTPDHTSRADSAAFSTAMRGGTVVRLVDDRTAPSGSQIRVVQPLERDNSGRIPGVLELGLPYEDIENSVHAELERAYRSLAVGLFLLYLTQAALSWWTTRRIRRSAAENEHRALHDELTALPNRRLFQRKAEAVMAGMRDGGRPAAVVLVDLDHFKAVNDTLGHAAGDDLLCATAARLIGSLRAGDVVARLGGDEFGLILDGVGDVEVVRGLLDRVRAELARELILCDVPLSVEASFGVALVTPGLDDVMALLQRADVAMYEAKRAGSEVVVWGAELDTHSAQRLALQAELRRALERDELVLHYQPQIDLSDGQIVGVEALVRWQHPERGLLAPAAFLDAVEHSALINPFTSWVLERAVRDCAGWRAAGLDWAVSVNVSVRNLVGNGLALQVADLLAVTGVPASKLCIEVTETALAADQATLAAAVGTLADLGVDISIDDFGTGFTTFAMLRSLRINEIKVDRAFVDGVLHRDEDRAIVAAVVGLAGGIGCRVVAEGVENAEVGEWLRLQGCTRAQGFHYSRPQPWPELCARFGVPDAHTVSVG